MTLARPPLVVSIDYVYEGDSSQYCLYEAPPHDPDVDGCSCLCGSFSFREEAQGKKIAVFCCGCDKLLHHKDAPRREET
jgi:hypothetical protein